jgi:hypothetical protein
MIRPFDALTSVYETEWGYAVLGDVTPPRVLSGPSPSSREIPIPEMTREQVTFMLNDLRAWRRDFERTYAAMVDALLARDQILNEDEPDA